MICRDKGTVRYNSGIGYFPGELIFEIFPDIRLFALNVVFQFLVYLAGK